MSRKAHVFFLIALFLLVSACTLPAPGRSQPGPTGEPNQPVTSDDTPIPTAQPGMSGETVAGVAAVDSIEIAIAESFPVQVFVTARGNLPDGCTTIGNIETQLDGNTFNVTITTTRPKDAVCTEALVPFEEVFPLDVLGLSAGRYTVIVNGVIGEFELAMDNISPGEPASEPTEATASIQGLVWHDVCEGIGGGEGCVAAEGGGFRADGVLDPGEPGIAGVEVTLGAGACPASGLASARTDGEGRFSFTGLEAGTYCLTIDPLSDSNSEVLMPGGFTAPVAQVAQVEVDLTSGEALLNVNFGWDFQLLPEPDQAACTDKASFVKDVTVEDDTTFPSGQTFVKTWRLKNEGTCTWTSDYALVFSAGDQMGGESPLPLPESVEPGSSVDLSITLTAPDRNGTYRGEWLLQNAKGQTFGVGKNADEPFWVQIVVTELISDLDLGPADWVDTFDDDNNWFMLNTNNVRWKVEDGALEMKVLDAGGVEQWGLANRPDVTDFYLEATFVTGDQCSGLDRYGMLVRAPDPNQGYVLNISCDGRFRLYKWDGQNYNPLQEWKNDANILPGPDQTNKIGFWANGSELKIYINGVLVAAFTDNTYASGRFGLLVGSTDTEDLKIFVEEIAYWLLED